MNMNTWLESKLFNTLDKFDDLYVIPEQLKFIGFNNSDKFGDFYEDSNDIDIKNNPSYYPDMIKHSITNGYFNELLEDEGMDKILDCTEIYKTNIVIIYPTINRFHCNFLFKMMMKNIKHNKMLLSFECVSYVNTSVKKRVVIQNIVLPIMSTSDKINFYKFCYDNSVTENVHNKNNTCLPNSNKLQCTPTTVTPYKNISEKILNAMSAKIENEICKYYEYIEKLWTNVILQYANSEYKNIIGKVNDGISGFIKFNDFMKLLPVFQTMIKIKNRLTLTLEIMVTSASESTIGHTEKLEQQSLE